MRFIHDSINLRDYVKAPEFAPKVRRASDFMEDVATALDPVARTEEKYPSMLSQKARQLRFRPKEVTCWGGFNGHRKSMFTSQVALDLAVQRQKVLVVSLEMTPVVTMTRMTRQALESAFPGRQQVADFHRWTDDRLWLFDHVGRLDVDNALALCRYFASEFGGQHVFLDSFMKICDSEESMDKQKAFTTGLCEVADETGLHLHVIVHCRKPGTGDESKRPTKYDIKGTGSISDQAHNVVMVWSNKAKQEKLERNPHDFDAQAEPDAVVACEKQRNGSWEGALKFWHHEGSLRFCDERTTPVEPYNFQGARRA